jgi:hypothetical protein
MQSTPVAERALCPLRLRRGVSTQIHRLRARCCPCHRYVTLFARAPRIPGRNLRLTDACRSLIRRRDVGMRRSPDGVRVQHGAARCGQNCGHPVATRRPGVMPSREPSLVPLVGRNALFGPRCTVIHAPRGVGAGLSSTSSPPLSSAHRAARDAISPRPCSSL